jgi:hypothetical protein
MNYILRLVQWRLLINYVSKARKIPHGDNHKYTYILCTSSYKHGKEAKPLRLCITNLTCVSRTQHYNIEIECCRGKSSLFQIPGCKLYTS